MDNQTKLNTWVCPHCLKQISPNYKYKSNLRRRLCFRRISDHHQQAIFEIKDELKAELTNMFRDAIEELNEKKSSANQQPSVNHQQLSTNPAVVKQNNG